MKWMLLTPREVELIRRHPARGDNANHIIMRKVQGAIDYTTGELELSETELNEVRSRSRCWRDGYEKELRAILAAADRHP